MFQVNSCLRSLRIFKNPEALIFHHKVTQMIQVRMLIQIQISSKFRGEFWTRRFKSFAIRRHTMFPWMRFEVGKLSIEFQRTWNLHILTVYLQKQMLLSCCGFMMSRWQGGSTGTVVGSAVAAPRPEVFSRNPVELLKSEMKIDEVCDFLIDILCISVFLYYEHYFLSFFHCLFAGKLVVQPASLEISARGWPSEVVQHGEMLYTDFGLQCFFFLPCNNCSTIYPASACSLQ